MASRSRSRSSSARRPSGKRSRTAYTGPRLKKAAKTLGKRLMPRSRSGKRAMAIGLGLTAVLALTIGLVAESVLSYTVTVMGTLGAVAVKRAEQWQAEHEQERRANRARPAGAGPRPQPTPPPQPGGTPNPPPSGGRVKCTQTGRPAEECDCASRHVATVEGAARYGRNIGDPIGRRKPGAGKPSATTKPAGS